MFLIGWGQSDMEDFDDEPESYCSATEARYNFAGSMDDSKLHEAEVMISNRKSRSSSPIILN